MRTFDDGVGSDKLAGGAAGSRARLGMAKRVANLPAA